MADKPLDRYAEKAATWEREPELDGRDADMPRPDPEPELADDDLVLGEVDDKGHGTGTFVAAGDPIPAHLAGLPRRPAAPRESRKR
jgi:hypothetical protein